MAPGQTDPDLQSIQRGLQPAQHLHHRRSEAESPLPHRRRSSSRSGAPASATPSASLHKGGYAVISDSSLFVVCIW